MILIGLLLTLLIPLIYYIFNLNFSKKLPPGPISLPFIGTSHVIKKYSIKYGGFHKALIELCKLYKTDILWLKLNGIDTVVIQGDILLNEALQKDEFLGRPNNFFIKLRCLGTDKGISMTDGPLWQEQRLFAMKQLHHLGFGKTTMESLIQEEIQNLINKYKDGGRNINLKVPVSRCVINVLWALVAGYKFDREEDVDELLNLMYRRSKAFDLAGGMLSQFPWVRFIVPETCGYNLIKCLNNKLKNIISATIVEHKATYCKHITRDYIDAFLHEMYNSDDKNTTFTEDQLIMVCLDFFIAGSITTSYVIDFLLLHMILRPDVQRRAYEEINSILQPQQLSSVSQKYLMPYTQAIILENERITPVLPVFGPRRTLNETTLGQFTIPKNTTVFFNHYPSNHDPNKWESPDKFLPERFLKMGIIEGKNKLFTYGKGRRRCPGEKLGDNFIFLFFSSFMNYFKITNTSEQSLTSLNSILPGLMLTPKPYEVDLMLRQKECI